MKNSLRPRHWLLVFLIWRNAREIRRLDAEEQNPHTCTATPLITWLLILMLIVTLVVATASSSPMIR